MLKIYVDILLENGQSLENPLFPNLTNQGKSVLKGSRLSGDNARKVLKTTFVKVGFSINVARKFGLHSFRMCKFSHVLVSGSVL